MKSSRLLRALAVSALACGVLAASAYAANIVGSSRANVLRGTAKGDVILGLGGNDKLYGLGGNDKLYGGAGNDTLVGGPGSDLLDCGPGQDTAIADAADTVRSNCEIVKGLTVTTTTTTTTTPPPPVYQLGHYAGQTSSFEAFSFDLDATGVHGLQWASANWGCTPADYGYLSGGGFPGIDMPINTDGSFHTSFSGHWGGSPPIGGAPYQVMVSGQVKGSTASGTFEVDTQFTDNGTAYNCSTGTPSWTATLTP